MTSLAVSGIGILVGVCGIVLALAARSRAAKAAAAFTALSRGGAGAAGVDPRAVRDMAIIRYDALEEMSGQLSFSVALLNALGNGVVLTSINGRSETRTYAKIIAGGHGTQPLSPEEEQAVRTARLGQTPPGQPSPGDVDGPGRHTVGASATS